MDLLYFLQQILLIAAILLLSLSLIITPKELNIPASSTAYGKSYKSLVPHVLLLLFTCGIYYLVWIYRTTDSLNACKNEEYRTPINKLLLCMFVPFYSIYWTYKSAHRIDMLGYEKRHTGRYCNAESYIVAVRSYITAYTYAEQAEQRNNG